jgi:hypothetical protein
MLGIPLGALLGFWVELACLEPHSYNRHSRPPLGPLLGAIVVAGVWCYLVNAQMSALVKRLLGGLVVGLTVGGLLGAFVFGPARTEARLAALKEENPGMHSFVMHSGYGGAIASGCEHEALRLCLPFGVLGGVLMGLGLHAWRSWRNPEKRPQPAGSPAPAG